jgi:hypothetical protein
LRIVERCSKLAETEKHLSNLEEKLTERNYPKELIVENFEKAKKKDCETHYRVEGLILFARE